MMTDDSLPPALDEASINIGALVEATALPTFVLDLARMVVTANDGFWRLLRREEGTRHLPAEDVFSRDSVNDLVAQAQRTNQRLERFVEVRRPNGTFVWHPFFATAFTQAGQSYGGLMIGFDANEDRRVADPGRTSRVPTTGGLRKRSEAETGEQAPELKPEVMKALADRSPAGVLLLDEHGACVYANPSAATVFGRQLHSILGRDLISILDPMQPESFLRQYQESIEAEGGGAATLQVRHSYFDHRQVHVEWFEIPANPGHIGVVLRDVTGTLYFKRAHKALAHSSPRHRLSDLVGSLCEVVMPHAAAFARRGLSNGNPFINEVVKVRREVDDVWGYASADVHEAQPYVEELSRLLDRGDPMVFAERPLLLEYSRVLRGPLIFAPVMIRGSAIGYLMVVFEREPDPVKVVSRVIQMFGDRMAAAIEAEAMALNLVESRKRECIGHLARGVSHDFNNVLMSVMGNLELAERKIDGDASVEVVRHIKAALQAAQRGVGVVKGMIEYSDGHEEGIQRVALSSVVGQTLRAFEPTLPDHIRLITDVKESGLVVGQPKRLLNALLNILTNARDAVEDRCQQLPAHLGQITVELASGIDASGGQRLVLAVIDNGIGMDEDTQRKLLDPFFTTREPGRGTGLGMALAHAIVSSMGGIIDVTSTLGEGTRISLSFPAIGHDAAAKPAHLDSPYG